MVPLQYPVRTTVHPHPNSRVSGTPETPSYIPPTTTRILRNRPHCPSSSELVRYGGRGRPIGPVLFFGTRWNDRCYYIEEHPEESALLTNSRGGCTIQCVDWRSPKKTTTLFVPGALQVSNGGSTKIQPNQRGRTNRRPGTSVWNTRRSIQMLPNHRTTR